MLLYIDVRRPRQPGPPGKRPRRPGRPAPAPGALAKAKGRKRIGLAPPRRVVDVVSAAMNPAGWALGQLADSALDVAGMADMGEAPTAFWFPSTIEALAGQVRSDVQSAAVYVSALRKERGAAIVTNELLSQFKLFYNEVVNWIAKIGFWEKLNGATATRLQTYQKRIREWRELLDSRARSAGSKTVAPPLPSNPPAPAIDFARVARWAAIAGGALLAYKVASDTGVLKAVKVGG